jgi:hypothetical protein
MADLFASYREKYPADDPRVHVGPIAVGEQVVAHPLSQTYKITKQTYGDALAVEMEG